MENTLTKVFTRTLYENNESSSCVCLQCNHSVFNPFYKRRLFSAESVKSKACQLKLGKIIGDQGLFAPSALNGSVEFNFKTPSASES